MNWNKVLTVLKTSAVVSAAVTGGAVGLAIGCFAGMVGGAYLEHALFQDQWKALEEAMRSHSTEEAARTARQSSYVQLSPRGGGEVGASNEDA